MKKLLFILLLSAHALIFCQETKENADLGLALKLYNDNLFDLALEQFKRVADQYPNTQQGIQAKYYTGLSQFQLKKYEECRTTLTNFAVNYPHFPATPNAWWKVAESFEIQERKNEAASTYEKLKLFHPTSEKAPLALIKAADLYIDLNDYENAQKTLRIVVQDYGFSNLSYLAKFKSAEVLAKMEMNEKSISEFNKLIDENTPADIRCKSYLSIGKIYAKIGNIEKSELYFDKIHKEYNEKNIKDSADFELASIYSDLGEYDKAVSFYLNIVDTSSLDSSKIRKNDIRKQSEINLAKLLIDMSDDRALKLLDLFERKESDKENLQRLYFLKGEAFRKINDLPNSNKYYEKFLSDSISDYPDKKEAILALAGNYERTGLYRNAVDRYNYYINTFPNDKILDEVLFKTGTIYFYNLKFSRRAIAAFSDLLQKFQNSKYCDDALYYLGLGYEQNKDIEKALETFSELKEKYFASDYIGLAEDKINSIKSGIITESDKGYQKLGNLMQDVMSDKPKAEIAFKLGEVYFNDLKNYKAALSQFDIVSSSQVNDSLKSESMIYQSFCHYFLVQTDSTEKNKAISSLLESIKKYPKNPRSEQMLEYYYNILIRDNNSINIRNISMDFLKNYPSFGKKNLVIMNILKTYNEEGKFKELISYEKENSFLENDENYRSDLIYFLGSAYKNENIDSLCEKYYYEYITKYVKGKYSADILFTLSGIAKDKRDYKNALIFSNRNCSEFYYVKDINFINLENIHIYLESGDYSSAYKILLNMLNTYSGNTFLEPDIIEEMSYLNGLLNEKIGRNYEAKRKYLAYISKYKNGKYIDEALFNLGRICQTEGRNNLALAYFRKIDVQKANSELSMKVADYLYESESYKDAANRYQDIARFTKNDKIRKYAEFKVLLLNYKMNNIEEAQRLQNLFIDKYPKVEEFIIELDYERAYYYYIQKNYEMANKIFSNIIDDYENNEFAGWSNYWLGKYEESNSQNDKAQKRFETVIQKFPDTRIAARANLSLGNLFYRSEKYDLSLKYYRNIVDKRMDEKKIYGNALENLIVSYSELGLYDAGIEYCRKFIELFPQDVSILEKKMKIGILYQNLKYYDQAIVHYESMLDLVDKKTECETRYYIGECYYSKSDYQRALVEFLKVPYIFPKNVQSDWTAAAFYMAGQSYEKMSKYEQAITMYQQIIDWPNTDSIFKAKAAKEIERVRTLLLPNNK